ncbi:MAG: hypothetical protein CMJ81_10335 [Planctomycetaceae bacterium]|nr:hypothetical protein [Planctomycetaceae bacterium]MBP62554.1 hypothetical protein [Planctomycetaceae bacterium]
MLRQLAPIDNLPAPAVRPGSSGTPCELAETFQTFYNAAPTRHLKKYEEVPSKKQNVQTQLGDWFLAISALYNNDKSMRRSP